MYCGKQYCLFITQVFSILFWHCASKWIMSCQMRRSLSGYACLKPSVQHFLLGKTAQGLKKVNKRINGIWSNILIIDTHRSLKCSDDGLRTPWAPKKLWRECMHMKACMHCVECDEKVWVCNVKSNELTCSETSKTLSKNKCVYLRRTMYMTAMH